MSETGSDPCTAPHDSKARQVELLISNLLRIGVLVSLILIVAGMILTFAHHHDYFDHPPAVQRHATPGAGFPHTLRDVYAGLKDLRGQSVIIVGLLLLIATPVMRVAVSILGFAYERDFVYVAITCTVLILLIVSFVIGKVD